MSLANLFKAAPDSVDDKDKLLDLFRNRAELKKEFAALRNEKYRLQDRIKQQEGAQARVQHKMDHLESLLLEREWAHSVVVFYQLRRLAEHCHVKLARFAEELKQQQELLVNGKALNTWRAQLDAQASAIEAEIAVLRKQREQLEDNVRELSHALSSMNGIVKIFRGRRRRVQIEKLATRLDAERITERELLEDLDRVRGENPPDHCGLANATKRSINFMILSFLQQLYLTFSDNNLAALAKEASDKSVGAVNYGTKFECNEIVENIEARWDSMESIANFAEAMRRRAKFISDRAVFRGDEDVIPVAGSVATIFEISENGVVREKDVNLLGDNYFGVAKVLSR